MKSRLNYKMIGIILLLIFSSNVFSGTLPESKFHDRFSERISNPAESSAGSLRTGIAPDDDPRDQNNKLGSVGNAGSFVLVFGIIYGICIFERKRKRSS